MENMVSKPAQPTLMPDPHRHDFQAPSNARTRSSRLALGHQPVLIYPASGPIKPDPFYLGMMTKSKSQFLGVATDSTQRRPYGPDFQNHSHQASLTQTTSKLDYVSFPNKSTFRASVPSSTHLPQILHIPAHMITVSDRPFESLHLRPLAS